MKNAGKLLMLATYFLFITSCSNETVDLKETPLGNNLVELESGVVVEKRGEEYIWEGDIVLSDVQLKSLSKTGSIQEERPDYIGPDLTVHPVFNIPMTGEAGQDAVPRSFSIYPSPYNLWAMVRFTYNSNLTTAERNKIASALHEIESNTNVRFYNATGEPTVDPIYGFEYPYIDFFSTGNQDVSSSSLGRVGGRQQISLADFAFNSFSNRTIIHEILHALGMRHEHTRTDRDNYVVVNYSNLTSLGSANFQIPSTNYYQQGLYDFNSIMGYSSSTTSTSMVHDTSEPMYTKLDGSLIYATTSISEADRMWLNTFYVPYIARSDVYAELDDIVYNPDNTIMTASERLALQAQLNNGNPTPPDCCRIPNDF